MQHDHTFESTRTVLRLGHILPMPQVVQIQTEMRIDGLSLIETAVGSRHSKEIEKNIAKYKKIADLKEEMATVKKSNKAPGLGLEMELAEILAGWEREHAEMKKGLKAF